jgi:hypothetical protein
MSEEDVGEKMKYQLQPMMMNVKCEEEGRR